MTALALAATLIPALGPEVTSAATATSRSAKVMQGADAPRSLTLINGDRVTVTGTDTSISMALQGHDGRPVQAYTTKRDGDTYVYPHTVMPYVTAGLLDQQLFNITRLLAYGYDDASTDHLPLIARYADAARAHSKAVPEGSTRMRPLTSIQGAALSERRGAATEFWSSLTRGVDQGALRRASAPGTSKRADFPLLTGGIERIWLDGKVKADLADTVAQIGAPAMWETGTTGKGVDIAVLDTGVDAEHPDLTDRIAAAHSFVPGKATATDGNGHGTHVASTVAGTGAASDGKEKGVAPDARLHIGKVMDDDGTGAMSWIVEGMEWAARDQHARVVNMSLSTQVATDGTDPLSVAVDSLSAETGALFTAASGNGGPLSAVGAPGSATEALTVGAVDKEDSLAEFSTGGPRIGDAAIKPELTAPGVDVLAARARTVGGEGYYMTASGTSMATPHVTGAAALLAAAHPGWTGRQIKDALVSTAKPTPRYTAYQAGNGRVDVAAAGSAAVIATGAISYGRLAWPPAPGAAEEREVTYTNTSAASVTLDLSVAAANAPAALFSLSAPRVTLPAHGTATVTVIAHMEAAAPSKTYDARLVASSGGVTRTVTALGVSTEDVRHTLDIEVRDRSGKPFTGDAAIHLLQAEDPGLSGVIPVAGGAHHSLDLSEGVWWVAVALPVRGTHGPRSQGLALLEVPELRLDRDTTIVLDASRARRVRTVTPQESVTTDMRVSYRRTFASSSTFGWTFNVDTNYDSFWTLPAKRVSNGTFALRARWRNEQPALKLTAGKEAVDDILVRRGATPLPKGERRLVSVYLGQGAAADYTGRQVRGKAAVVLASETVPLADQAAAAAAAGAAMLIVVDSGAGPVDPRVETSPPLTVVGVGRDQGERLIRLAERGSALRVFSRPTTDYLYDLTHAWDNAVPGDPVYRPRVKELARVNVAFNNFRAADAMESRSDIRVDDPVAGGGYPLPRPAQGTRTDWVSTDPGVLWEQAASVAGEVRNVDVRRRYKPGTVNREQWFAPISRPRLRYGGSDGTFRQDDMLFVSVPGWGDSGAHHAGWAMKPEPQAITSIYQGDTLLASSTGTLGTYTYGLAAERLPYRIVAERSRGTWANPYSTATKTVWDFTSAAGELYQGMALPLIQLDYAVDTDRAGKARRNADITVTPSHLASVFADQSLPSSDTIREVGLELSYDDGLTWHRQPLKRASGGWTAALKAPRSASYVTLRATARDNQGNAVRQSITRAFGLR
ncbi:serine protease [Streptomyces sp. WAC 01325]|uniref:S8 family serine peptidase n=1 Tax=Streptomyces sp. WAC 01325 TaxID=2203202 RepID=UPI000F881F79|nr:S8 family serine peptidase [Streptomyces sp. WAC 01325]RSN01278.1 serine protease [Streptomyces sp. WAC 01325]